MIDVHIILRTDTPLAWRQQCLESASKAAVMAGYPVFIHPVDAVAGHIGQARANGYAQGSQSFVTYVDDDDYLLPNAFAVLNDALASTPDAIFPAELALQNGQFCDGPQRHHLAVYRRDQLIDHTAWVVCGDLAQMTAASKGTCIDVPERVYVHRLYQSPGRALRREHHEELRRARG
jgi:hypothetical protein